MSATDQERSVGLYQAETLVPTDSGQTEIQPYLMRFDMGTIKHLGLQMYSTLPPVIAELVANAWDADAKNVWIAIPAGPVDDSSEIVVMDDGMGMSDSDVRDAYLVIGRDRRKVQGDEVVGNPSRKVMGRKGIGKFSAFGIAQEIEVESVQNGVTSRFLINYLDLEKKSEQRQILLPPLPPTGGINLGTRVRLRHITKFRTQSIDITGLRRNLARRFSVIGEEAGFQVHVNGDPITVDERDLKRMLENDADGNPYLWEYDAEVKEGTGWRVTGWMGALKRTAEPEAEKVDRGIVIMARGKLVQEPFLFGATVGQQFALSYLVGELHAEFVDTVEDTISTTRNSLVWDTEANQALRAWGVTTVNHVAREWATKRAADNGRELAVSAIYQKFKEQARHLEKARAASLVDKLVRGMIQRNPNATVADQERIIETGLEFLQFDAFWDLAEKIADTDLAEPERLTGLFKEWEIVEAKEMMRVTEGRIATIRKLAQHIEENALEVPTLHKFLKQFPWILDPRWTLVDDEVRFSDVLRQRFPDEDELEQDRRIDFLCVREDRRLVVVEIKRPQSKANLKSLSQVKTYVHFMRDYAKNTTDPTLRVDEVEGYLLVGGAVDTWEVREELRTLETSKIYVRRYSDLLGMVERVHADFMQRYEALRAIKAVEAAGLTGE